MESSRDVAAAVPDAVEQEEVENEKSKIDT